MAYQDDKFENFYAKLPIGRAARAAFADFTVEAVAAPGVDALISGHGAGLKTARDAYRQEMVDRGGAAGTSQSGTVTEAEAFESFQTFIQTLDAKVLQGHFLDHAADEARLYPELLSGLTQAPKKHRLTRLTTYTEALEATPALPLQPIPAGAPAGTVAKTPGQAARALLTIYSTAAKIKVTGRTLLKDAIADLTPAGLALCEALWDVHCAALYTHRRTPMQARKYFDFAHLPTYVTKGSKKKPS